jgi:hypothetical protein
MSTYRCKICLTSKSFEKMKPFPSMPHDPCLFKFMITIPCALQWESPLVRDIHKVQDQIQLP